MRDGRFALIVASSRYSDATLTQLQAPAYDADSLAAVLGAATIGGFQVETLTDQPAQTVLHEIETFFDGRRREDLVLLYFSGHGILDEGARLYFATTDTRVDRPRSTAVPAAFVNDVMSECRSRRQVLVLDCCNSGSFARGIKAGGKIGTAERFEGRGRVVITASDALQYAFEAGRIEGEGAASVFTQSLVDGLRTGGADLNGDGYVSLDELYDYVYGRVLDVSPQQRPGKWAFGVEGQILIARTTAGAEPVAVAERARLPAAAPVATPAPRRERIRALTRRRGLWAVAALAVAGALAGTAAFLLTRDDEPKSPAGRTTPSLASGRDATLAVYEAWLAGELEELDDDLISASARRTLSRLPTEPVTPSVPTMDDCYGSPENVTCTYAYAVPIPFYLRFRSLFEASGPRVVEVGCFDGDGNLVAGGVAACAQRIRDS
jgi:Caspase domain